MKKFANFIGIILMIVSVMCDIIELLAVPALFIIIGILNSYPWRYYAISIGGYFALFIILEVIIFFIFKAFKKKYTPIIERKLKKYSNNISNKI